MPGLACSDIIWVYSDSMGAVTTSREARDQAIIRGRLPWVRLSSTAPRSAVRTTFAPPATITTSCRSASPQNVASFRVYRCT